MSFDEEAFFVAKTPLNVEVRTTTGYWKYWESSRVGPNQVFDFRDQCLKKEADFGLRRAIFGLKSRLRQERNGNTW